MHVSNEMIARFKIGLQIHVLQYFYNTSKYSHKVGVWKL